MASPRQKVMIANLVVVMFLFMGCATGGAPSPTPEALGEAQVKERTKVATKEAWEKEWEATINAARKEGVVNVYSTTVSEARFLISRTFRERYGVEAEYVTGIGALLAQKIDAERRAGLYLADVFTGGPTTFFTYLKPKGYFVPLEPTLLLPEVKDPHNWLGGKLNWLDKERLVLAPVASANIPVAINTDLVKPKEIASHRDLLDPRWKGKIMLYDPTITGLGNSFLYVASLLMGRDYGKELAKQEPVMSRDYRLQMEWLARGKYSILIGPEKANLTDFIKAGAPLRGVALVEGGSRSSSDGNVALFDRAPHPNGAKLFINWFLSKEGQTAYIQTGFPSARIDVPPTGIDPLAIIDPNLKYIATDTEEMKIEMLKNIDMTKEIFGPLMK